MSNIHLLPLRRWHSLDPEDLVDFAREERMSPRDALALAAKIARPIDRKLRRMGIPPEQRRAALDEWHSEVLSGLDRLAPPFRHDAG